MGGLIQAGSGPEKNAWTGSDPETKLPREPHNRTVQRSGFLGFLTQKRWAVIMVIAFLILIQIIGLILANRLGQTAHLIFDGLIYFVLLPVGTWLLIRQIRLLDKEREKAQVSSELQSDLSQKLGEVRGWQELLREIVSYLHRIAPQADVTLFVCYPGEELLQPEIACSRDGKVEMKPELPSSPLLFSIPNGGAVPTAAEPAAFWKNGAGPLQTEGMPHNQFEMPITHHGALIGAVRLGFSPGPAIADDPAHFLKTVLPVIALALESGLLQKAAAEQAAASETQRQEIAQTLHDTLAQNIGYLRLKLDQLTGENAIREIEAVLRELERMRATADEAYQQVRNTLDALNPTGADNLVSTLVIQARAISQRAGFSLRTSRSGKPQALPAATRQHILYIVREALHNIEKHAQASQVILQILWLDSELIIKITDNGVGFDPQTAAADGHYGLWIMQQRAREIGGTLEIGLAPDLESASSLSRFPGTEITLWVPFTAPVIPVGSIQAKPQTEQEHLSSLENLAETEAAAPNSVDDNVRARREPI